MQLTSFLSLSTLLLLSGAAQATQCDDNFSSSGNMLFGATFRTAADVQGVDTDTAMRNLQSYTSSNGFRIISADRSSGVISAANIKAAPGRNMPLDIHVDQAGAGVRVSMVYSTPAGATSPAEAVRTHFCKSIEAISTPGSTNNARAAGPLQVPAQARERARNLAVMTPEQQAKIHSAVLLKGWKDDRARQNFREAAETVTGFLQILSCISDYDGSPLNVYAAPDHVFPYTNFLGPMSTMKYHDKGACLTVVRLQGVSAPALNSLRFEVVFLAEDSGQSTISHHELVKQPDGQWLFTM